MATHLHPHFYPSTCQVINKSRLFLGFSSSNILNSQGCFFLLMKSVFPACLCFWESEIVEIRLHYPLTMRRPALFVLVVSSPVVLLKSLGQQQPNPSNPTKNSPWLGITTCWWAYLSLIIQFENKMGRYIRMFTKTISAILTYFHTNILKSSH